LEKLKEEERAEEEANEVVEEKYTKEETKEHTEKKTEQPTAVGQTIPDGKSFFMNQRSSMVIILVCASRKRQAGTILLVNY